MLYPVSIDGRVIQVTEAVYNKVQAKLSEIAEHDRRVHKELRQERVLPSEHQNSKMARVTEPGHVEPEKERSNTAEWKADKARRLHDLFKTYKPATSDLERMNKAFENLPG